MHSAIKGLGFCYFQQLSWICKVVISLCKEDTFTCFCMCHEHGWFGNAEDTCKTYRVSVPHASCCFSPLPWIWHRVGWECMWGSHTDAPVWAQLQASPHSSYVGTPGWQRVSTRGGTGVRCHRWTKLYFFIAAQIAQVTQPVLFKWVRLLGLSKQE